MAEEKLADNEQVAPEAGAPENQSRPGQEEAETCFNRDEMRTIMESVEEKNRQIDDLNNRLIRLQADFDNFRRRTRSEKEEMSQVVAAGVMTRLLPVLDNFDRALATGKNQDAGQLLTGVEMVYRQFTQILEGLGVKTIAATGNQFDPNLHEAVMRVEDADQPDGTVVEEFQKGYMANDKVLRPSMVKVVSNS